MQYLVSAMSRIGNQPIPVPSTVKVVVQGSHVVLEGPKGKLEWTLPPAVSAQWENSVLRVRRKGDSRVERSLHGLSRSLLANMVEGVSRGYRKELEIQGVGFKAMVQGQSLTLHLGKSHPIRYSIPPSIKLTLGAEGTHVAVEGPDKHLVGQVAADIRRFFPAEPYKGKGVRYVGEAVRRKEGKTVQ